MNKTKILVADDDKSICTLIKLILEKEGFEVSCLFDGESVVNEIAAGGKYDLIILDIMMPEMLGTNAAKKIKDICDTPIIFITARSSDEDKIEAYESGADDYLCKPFSSVELVLRVKAVLKRVFDNIFSNISKYADSQKPIYININVFENRIIIEFKNSVKESFEESTSTKIGLKCCERLMFELGGSITAYSQGKTYISKIVI